MSALVGASLVLLEGVVPILHMITRDRNRIALMSDYLGARALGIDNILCTSGTHQTLGAFGGAKNVYDLDPVQLMKSFAGEVTPSSNGTLCIGGTALPYADPAPLQMTRLKKKLKVGAEFLVTQPVYDIETFGTWWQAVKAEGIDKRAAVIAGIIPLLSAEAATAKAARRPNPRIPKEVIERIAAKQDAAAQRSEGIAIAVEFIEALKAMGGLRGFEVGGEDPDAILEVIDKAKLGRD
jgi:methylenetetrahydrofolate reductase (NADPH)